MARVVGVYIYISIKKVSYIYKCLFLKAFFWTFFKKKTYKKVSLLSSFSLSCWFHWENCELFFDTFFWKNVQLVFMRFSRGWPLGTRMNPHSTKSTDLKIEHQSLRRPPIPCKSGRQPVLIFSQPRLVGENKLKKYALGLNTASPRP